MVDTTLIDKLLLPLGFTGIIWLVYMGITVYLAIVRHKRDKNMELMLRDLWIDYMRNKK